MDTNYRNLCQLRGLQFIKSSSDNVSGGTDTLLRHRNSHRSQHPHSSSRPDHRSQASRTQHRQRRSRCSLLSACNAPHSTMGTYGLRKTWPQNRLADVVRSWATVNPPTAPLHTVTILFIGGSLHTVLGMKSSGLFRSRRAISTLK